MRLVAAILLVCVTALSLPAPSLSAPETPRGESGSAPPYVVAGATETMVVLREVETSRGVEIELGDETASLLASAPEVEVEAEVQVQVDSSVTSTDLELDLGLQELAEAASTTTTEPPRPGCNCKACWRGCQRKGYNWGLCLWKRCHCYY